MKKDLWRLGFHLMPPTGWLNDPNGLCQMNGVYHVFFQYTKDNPNGGNKSWGHYQSTDLTNWEFTGETVLPDTVYEKDGSYSGSALIENGNMYLFYTGNVKQDGDYDYITAGREANTIGAVTTDGIHLENKTLLMTNDNYPADCTCHVRDPKVWKDDMGYWMIQGARKTDDTGCVLLFHSIDRLHWTYVKTQTQENMGYMWECPDYFELDGQKILSISPQGLDSEEYRYQNVYQSGYYKVEGEIEGDCQLCDFREWDMGFDFYAPQTFVDEKKRRILVAWMGIPDADYQNKTVEDDWQHCLTMPRVLTMHQGIVRQQPVEEMKQLRLEAQRVANGQLMEDLSCFEVFMSHFRRICLGGQIYLEWDEENQIFKLRFEGEMGAGRRERKVKMDQMRNVHIYVDRSAIEIFINDGETVLSTRYYKDTEFISFLGEGIEDATLWELKKMGIHYAKKGV